MNVIKENYMSNFCKTAYILSSTAFLPFLELNSSDKTLPWIWTTVRVLWKYCTPHTQRQYFSKTLSVVSKTYICCGEGGDPTLKIEKQRRHPNTNLITASCRHFHDLSLNFDFVILLK